MLKFRFEHKNCYYYFFISLTTSHTSQTYKTLNCFPEEMQLSFILTMNSILYLFFFSSRRLLSSLMITISHIHIKYSDNVRDLTSESRRLFDFKSHKKYTQKIFEKFNNSEKALSRIFWRCSSISSQHFYAWCSMLFDERRGISNNFNHAHSYTPE